MLIWNSYQDQYISFAWINDETFICSNFCSLLYFKKAQWNLSIFTGIEKWIAYNSIQCKRSWSKHICVHLIHPKVSFCDALFLFSSRMHIIYLFIKSLLEILANFHYLNFLLCKHIYLVCIWFIYVCIYIYIYICKRLKLY